MTLSRQSAAFMENIKVLTYTSIALGKLDDEEVSGCKAKTFQLYLQCLRDNLAGFKVDKTGFQYGRFDTSLAVTCVLEFG